MLSDLNMHAYVSGHFHMSACMIRKNNTLTKTGSVYSASLFYKKTKQTDKQ